MKILVFGNEAFDFDSLPIRILPELKKRFPFIEFEIKDPNEEFEIPEELIVLDTIQGIDDAMIFTELSDLAGHANISLHDFDLFSNLMFLKKLGKLKKIKIIGVPPSISETEAIERVSAILRSI